MVCSFCHSETDSIKKSIQRGEIIEGCDNCLARPVQSAPGAAKYYREAMKKEYRKDLTQPNQREYAKAYPEDFRKRYGDEAFRKLG